METSPPRTSGSSRRYVSSSSSTATTKKAYRRTLSSGLAGKTRGPFKSGSVSSIPERSSDEEFPAKTITDSPSQEATSCLRHQVTADLFQFFIVAFPTRSDKKKNFVFHFFCVFFEKRCMCFRVKVYPEIGQKIRALYRSGHLSRVGAGWVRVVRSDP